MPPDSGMIFVVVVHLSPTHESALAELLGRTTAMKVVQATDGQPVETNCVCVIPPGKHMVTINGHLRLSDIEHERGKRVAVDLFFRSRADTHGPHALAVVLSGADADGALGIKRIKERGGLTIVQDPEEAEHPGMPRSAIDTGMIDWVLKVEQMPQRLLEYRDNGTRLKLPPEEGPSPAISQRSTAEENEATLRDILAHLHTRTGRDFSYYKRATIVRRIARRMQVNGVTELPAYLAFLRVHPGEAGALLQDLLISVTNFFRDRDAFHSLQTHIPELFENKTSNDLRLNNREDHVTEHVCDMMERQINHMVRLVDDRMEVSRITRGRIELRKELIEVSDFVGSAVEASRPLSTTRVLPRAFLLRLRVG